MMLQNKHGLLLILALQTDCCKVLKIVNIA